jgi:hypothetical protein
MQKLNQISLLGAVVGLLIPLITQTAQANSIGYKIGPGPNDIAGSDGPLFWNNGTSSGNVNVHGGDTAAATAAAVAAASGGVASGNMVTWEASLSGSLGGPSTMFQDFTQMKTVEPQPPPPVPDPSLNLPPPGFTVKIIAGAVIVTTGTLQETIIIIDDAVIIINSIVSFVPGETTDQLNNAVFASLTAQSGSLPLGFSFVQFNGSPGLYAPFNYSSAISEHLKVDGGGGLPGVFLGLATTGVVPEPTTWTMMLAGFAGLGFLGYRRARTSASAAMG